MSNTFSKLNLRVKCHTSVHKMGLQPIFHDFYRINNCYAKLFNYQTYEHVLYVHKTNTDESREITKTMELLTGPHKHAIFKILLEKIKRKHGLDELESTEEPLRTIIMKQLGSSNFHNPTS